MNFAVVSTFSRYCQEWIVPDTKLCGTLILIFFSRMKQSMSPFMIFSNATISEMEHLFIKGIK